MSRRYHHLSRAEREQIFRLHDAKVPGSQIAKRMGRHATTIYRELRRNYFFDEDPYFRGYFGAVAHDKARSRRMRGGKILRQPQLAAQIVEGLSKAWSPEQIAGRLRIACPGSLRVCHETIYQYVYSPEGRRLGLYQQLPRGRKSRRRRYSRKPRGLSIPFGNTIAERPLEIAKRSNFGHWEGDLVAFRKEYGKANLTTLVERYSRFIVVARNPSRHSQGVMAGIAERLAPLPSSLRQSITFDRGTEFAAFPVLRTKLGTESYFCRPSAPWQKGTVENSNGRLRRFLPLDTDIAQTSDRALQEVAERMNDTPRKCLGYRTPAEVFLEHIALLEQP